MSDQQLPPDVVIPRALGTIQAVWDETLDPPHAPGGGGGGGKPASKSPLPDGAFETRRAASEILASWCAFVGTELGLCVRRHTVGRHVVGQHLQLCLRRQADWNSDDGKGMAAWLVGQAEWLAEHESGPAAAEELDDIARELDRLAHPDRHDDLFIGRCPFEFVPGGPPCNRRLYWPKGAGSLRCAGCGVEDDVEGWLARMGDELPEHLTAVQLSTFLTRKLSREISHDLVRKWAAKKLLVAAGRDERGRPLYSAIDCLGPAREQIERSQRPPRRVA